MDPSIKRPAVEYKDTTPFDDSELQSLSVIIEALRNKVYGKDVRAAIVQYGEALVKLMTETGGNQNAEVAAARGTFKLLGIRLDAHENALSTKLDKSFVADYLSQITYTPEAVLDVATLNAKYPNGKPGIFITADGHKHMWLNGAWHDAGVYQNTALADESVPDSKLTKGSVDVMSSVNFDAKKSAFADKFPRSIYLQLEAGGITSSNGNETGGDKSVRSGFFAPEKNCLTIINRDRLLQYQMFKYNLDRSYVGLVFGWKDNQTFNVTVEDGYLYRIQAANIGAETPILIDEAKRRLLLTYSDERLTYTLDGLDLLNQTAVSIGGGKAPIFKENAKSFEIEITLANTEMDVIEGSGVKRIAAKADTRGQTFVVKNNSYLIWDTLANEIYVAESGPFNSGKLILAHNVGGIVQSGDFQKYYERQSTVNAIDQVPTSYWWDYMDKKIEEIRAAEQALLSGDAFIFITDVHWGDNHKRSPQLIEQIKRKTGIQKVFFGGDVPIAYGTKEKMMADTIDFNNQFRPLKRSRDLYSVIGNHDFTIKTSATDSSGVTLPVNEAYALFGREFERYTNIQQNKMYYYVDNAAAKLRYIFINTEESVDPTISWGVQAKISQDQADWLTNEALDVPAGWGIITIGHVPIHKSATSYSSKLDILKQIFEGYNARQKLDITSVDGVTATTDFTKAGGKVVAYLCGHNHKDQSFIDQGINYISTGCDAKYKNDVWERTSRTTNEQLFDVMFWDTTKKTLKTIRIGAGEDRSWDTLA